MEPCANVRYACAVLVLLSVLALSAPEPKTWLRPIFNARAVESNVPLFWREDSNQNGRPEPSELVHLWGIDPAPRDAWLKDGALTPQTQKAIMAMAAGDADPSFE